MSFDLHNEKLKKIKVKDDVFISNLNEIGLTLLKYKEEYKSLFRIETFFEFLKNLDKNKAYEIRDLYNETEDKDVFLFKCKYLINPFYKFVFNKKEYDNISEINMHHIFLKFPYLDEELVFYLKNKLFSFYLINKKCDDKELIEFFSFWENEFTKNTFKAYFLFVYNYTKAKNFYYKSVKYKSLNEFFNTMIQNSSLDALIKRVNQDTPLYDAYLTYTNNENIILEYKKLVSLHTQYENHKKYSAEKYENLKNNEPKTKQ